MNKESIRIHYKCRNCDKRVMREASEAEYAWFKATFYNEASEISPQEPAKTITHNCGSSSLSHVTRQAYGFCDLTGANEVS